MDTAAATTTSHADASASGFFAATATSIVFGCLTIIFVSASQHGLVEPTAAILHAALRSRSARRVVFGVAFRRRASPPTLPRNADAALQRASCAAVRSTARMALICFLAPGILCLPYYSSCSAVVIQMYLLTRCRILHRCLNVTELDWVVCNGVDVNEKTHGRRDGAECTWQGSPGPVLCRWLRTTRKIGVGRDWSAQKPSRRLVLLGSPPPQPPLRFFPLPPYSPWPTFRGKSPLRTSSVRPVTPPFGRSEALSFC